MESKTATALMCGVFLLTYVLTSLAHAADQSYPSIAPLDHYLEVPEPETIFMVPVGKWSDGTSAAAPMVH